MKTQVTAHPGKLMTTPLIILAILSIVAGFIEWPHNLVHLTLFSDFVRKSFACNTSEREAVPRNIFFRLLLPSVTLLGSIYRISNYIIAVKQ